MVLRWESKSQEELDRYFVEIFERLVRANRLYDAGHLSEAPNIASICMSVVYDHGTSVSLLEHFKLKGRADFVASCKPASGFEIPAGGIVMSNDYMSIEARITFIGQDYVPINRSRYVVSYVGFQEWWDGIVLSRHSQELKGREYIRRGELLKYIRNEETGSHVAGKYRRGTDDDKLARLMQGEYVDGYMQLNGGDPVTAELHAPAYATLRQIGWEVEQTMLRMRPDLTGRAVLAPPQGPRLRTPPAGMV